MTAKVGGRLHGNSILQMQQVWCTQELKDWQHSRPAQLKSDRVPALRGSRWAHTPNQEAIRCQHPLTSRQAPRSVVDGHTKNYQVVVHGWNPSTQEAEAGGSLVSLRLVWATKQVPGQLLPLKRETLFKKTNKQTKTQMVFVFAFL